MINYKKSGLRCFKQGRFSEAMNFFSMAYEQNKDEDLLFLIMLCSLAKKAPDEGRMLFEYSTRKNLQRENVNLDEILEVLESKSDEPSELDEQDAITYEDFKTLSKKSGFKNVFENIMFSTRVLISNKNDFLEFIGDLIKNDFLDMSTSYLESAANMFGDDERLRGLFEELEKRKNDENLHKR
ncbi:MAG: histidine kinase [Campylobacter sp.]|nr:histidine kinase [Campylobacter sp.]